MANTELPFVSVILPAKNEERYIRDALEGLSRQDYPTDLFEVIVVDNNSTDRTVEICKEYKVKLISFDRGPVGAVRNFGFESSQGEYIFFLDSDCIAPTSWISKAIKKLKKNNRLVLGGGCCLRDNPYFLEKYWLLTSKNGTTLPKDLLGGSMAMHRDAFKEAGMFSEKITSGEDTDLSKKLIQNGYDIFISEDMSVVHLGNPITIREFFSRQIWHSENYFKDLRISLSDPMFYLCLLALFFSFCTIFSALIMNSLQLTTFYLSGLLFLPGLLSAKRIFRSGSYIHFIRIPAIYLLDAIYLAGRSTGFLIGLKNRLMRIN